MPHQVAVTVQATVADGRGDDLAGLLERMRAEGAAANSVLPFAEIGGVHFARLFVIEAGTDLDGGALPASLFYMADVDAPLDRHLRDLASTFGSGADAVFGHCEGYPDEPSPAPGWRGCCPARSRRRPSTCTGSDGPSRRSAPSNGSGTRPRRSSTSPARSPTA